MSTSHRVRYPQGHVLLRNLSRDYPVVSHGEGVYLFDQEGRRYLDAVSGAFVVSVGHGNREVVDRIAAQLGRVGYVNGTQFTTEATEALAERLARLAAPLGLDKAFFLSSGSEAVEAALKFARQLCVERGEPGRHKLIARSPSYHGNTLYSLSASDRPHYKKVFGPLLHDVVQVPAPYPYRFPGQDYAAQGAEYYARELEATIEREGAASIYAFILEPVAGSSAGAAVAPPGYFSRIEEICRRHGILIVADEVLCGTARTGPFFASQGEGLTPDILILAKGINGGYAPLSAVLVRSDHVEQIRSHSGGFLHAQTFLQAPCMTAAGLAVVEYLERHEIPRHVADLESHFMTTLRERLKKFPTFGHLSGRGLLAGVEVVEDPATRKPFPRERRIAEKLVAAGLEHGITLWPNVGQADGTNGDLLMIAPPLIATRAHVDELGERLERTFAAVFGN